MPLSYSYFALGGDKKKKKKMVRKEVTEVWVCRKLKLLVVCGGGCCVGSVCGGRCL